MAHDFLVLSLLFLLPGCLIWHARPDLRPLLKRMALISTPFAATERLFYPTYWTPKFLFDLADHIGFGIEDVLFVIGLGAFTSTAYAVVFRRTPAPSGAPRGALLGRALVTLVLALSLVGLMLAAGVPILYASVAAMLAVAGGIVVLRPDMALPSLLGALLSAAIYLGLCLVFAALVPGVFERTWRPSVLLPGMTLLGVPLDEILYGLGAGFAATAFPPWAIGFRYAPLRHAGRER